MEEYCAKSGERIATLENRMQLAEQAIQHLMKELKKCQKPIQE